MDGQIKLKKVTFEHVNGDIECLEGEVAQKWIDELNNLCVLSSIRSQGFSEYKWKKIKTNKKKHGVNK